MKDPLPQPFTDGEMYDILILESTNEKTKCDILGRMHFLASISGNKQIHEQFMGKYQAQAKQSELSRNILLGMKKEWESDQQKRGVDKSVAERGKKAVK